MSKDFFLPAFLFIFTAQLAIFSGIVSFSLLFSLLFCYLFLLCYLPQNCKQIFYLVSKKLHSLKISNNILFLLLLLLKFSFSFCCVCVVIANAVAVVVVAVLLICCPTTILVDRRVDSGRKKDLQQFLDLHMKFLKLLIK